MPGLDRRRFLGAAASVSMLGLRWVDADVVRIGLCADAHKDIIHDADRRLGAFVDEAIRRRPDFLLQLGDFCCPKPENRGFLRIWERFEGPRYHVLGNHDIDGGFTWGQAMAYYGMERPYSSFDRGGFHFVLLDGNERPPVPSPGYPRYIGREQLRWLETDLASTRRPTVVFSHQSLENPGGVENREEVRAVLERANAGGARVVACLSGHHHIDYLTQLRGIAYVQINSLSYYWVGERYARRRFDEATEAAFPALRRTIPYRDPLYAFLTLDPAAGTLTIEGVRSEFLPPGPSGLGLPPQPENNRPSAAISDRRIELAAR